MEHQPLAVAQDGPADSEKPDAHNGREQVQDGRLFAGPEDEPAGQPGQGNSKEGRQGPQGAGAGEFAAHRGEQPA
jgi:hypothetical protein